MLLCIILFFCCAPEKESPITIVDFGHHSRATVGRGLQIVNKSSPKVIGMYVYYTQDSLYRDTTLEKAIRNAQNIVLLSGLHRDAGHYWDSLELSHPKFRFGERGFCNFTITEDSVFVPEIPMRQKYRDETEFAFSYIVANKFSPQGVHSEYTSGYADFTFSRRHFRKKFKVISLDSVLNGRFDPKDFIGKIVLFGTTVDDTFYLNEDRVDKISGVEIQACLIEQILD